MRIDLIQIKEDLELNYKPSNPFFVEGTHTSLQWTEYPGPYVEDDNKSFTLELLPINDDGEYELCWEGDTIPSGGSYSKTIKTLVDFGQAMDDWETMRNWE